MPPAPLLSHFGINAEKICPTNSPRFKEWYVKRDGGMDCANKGILGTPINNQVKKQYILTLVFIFLTGCATMPPKPKPELKKPVKEPVSVKIGAPFKLLADKDIPLFIDTDNKESFFKAAEKN